MSQVSYGTITITDTNDIESITVEYNRNQSSSDAPLPTDSGWSTTRPDWAQGYYIWQRTRVHKSGTTADKDVIGTAVCITGSTGSSGISVTISSIKYAISTTESQPADSSFTYTSVPTVAEGSWLWTLVTYSNGSKAYTKSKQGVSGDSITVSKVEYQSGTSPTSAPTGTWQTSIPTVAEGNYLWTKTTYSDGNYTYSVAKQGKSGTSVSVSSTSTTYQVSTSPTTTPTGEWKTTVQSTTTGQYLWTRTIVTYSDGNSTTSYSVAAHGATGTSISISSIKYAVSSTDSQPADSSFTYTSVPTVNEGQWLWTLTTYSNGSKMYTKSKQGKSGNDGQSLTATKTEYTTAANNVTINSSNHTSYTWTTNTPDYDASKPAYWGRVTNTYANPAKTEYLFYKDEALTKAVADAAIANSVAQHANENAQGALSISRATQQHFWFNSTTSGSIEAGAYITDTPIDTFKSGKNGGYLLARSDGLELGRGTNKFMTLSATALNFYRPGTNTIDATLTSKGLVLSKGGIEAGAKNTTNYIYIYSDDDATNHKLTINSHEASDWRIVAGKNFGVDKAGNLYASGANITGKVTITSGSNVYTKTEADAAYDTKGAASAVQTNLDNLEVGGRNLFGYGSDLQTSLDGLNNRDNGFSIVTEDGIKCAHVSGALTTTKYLQSKLSYIPRPSETFTYSCFIKLKNIVRGTTNPMCEFYFSGQTIDGSWKAANAYKAYVDGEYKGTSLAFDRNITDTKWHHFAVVGTYDNANFTGNFQPNIYLRDCTGDLYIHHVKVERGNKATDWTPAPEDVQAEIDAKKSVHTLETSYSYNYSQLLTYANEYTTSWTVSSTTGVKTGDTVRLKMSVKDMSNTPVYIVGTVTSIVSETRLTITSHGLDTTVIDGGNILTNSIGANQIKANSLTIGKIATAEQEKILNSKIEIGGRNLVWDTEWNHVSTRWSDWGSPTTREIVTINGKQWLHLVTTTTSYQGYSQAQDKRNGYGEIKAGDKVIISYSAYAKTAGQKCTVGCHWRDSSGTTVAQNWFSSTLTTTEKRYISAVFTIPNNAVGFNVMVGDETANAQELWISQVKIEFGTKATDWTPAPEDIQSNAKDYADTVAYTVKAELDATKIDVVGESTSLLDNINAISDQITLLASRINFGNITVADNLAQLNTAVSIDTATSTVYVGDQSSFHVRINGTELGFYQRAQRVAYINNNQLYITQSVVLQQMDLGTPVANGGLGQWSWKVHPNGKSPSRNNLNLKWIG